MIAALLNNNKEKQVPNGSACLFGSWQNKMKLNHSQQWIHPQKTFSCTVHIARQTDFTGASAGSGVGVGCPWSL
jgi:hypothetical protein